MMNSEASINVAVAMDTSGSTTNSSNNRSSVSRKTDAMILVGNKNNKKNGASKKWKMRRAGKAAKGGGRGCRQRRLWQLPESSILEYTKWIQDKLEEDRSPSEERFLWRCMIRSLGVVSGNLDGKRGRQERIREFVDRLETKEELTETEQHFVRLYRKRKRDRKTNRQQQRKQHQQETEVSWMRGSSTTDRNSTEANRKSKKKKKKGAGFEPQASLESLRESMNKMGLSSDKLKQVRFADPPLKEQSNRAKIVQPNVHIS